MPHVIPLMIKLLNMVAPLIRAQLDEKDKQILDVIVNILNHVESDLIKLID